MSKLIPKALMEKELENDGRPIGGAKELSRVLEDTITEDSEHDPFEDYVSEAYKHFKNAMVAVDQINNLRKEKKEVVLKSLETMYTIIEKQHQSRSTLAETISRQSTERETRIKELERKYKKQILELTKTISKHDVRIPVQRLIEEVEELKLSVESQLVPLKQLDDVTKQLNKTTSELEVAAEKIKEPLTYANVLASPPGKKRQDNPYASNHVVIVKSINEDDSSEHVMKKIKETVVAKESGIKVDKLRKAKNQKVVLSCNSKKCLLKLKEKLKRNNQLIVEEGKPRDPLVIVHNVPYHFKDEDIIEMLLKQNEELIGDINNEDYRMIIKYRRKSKNPSNSHVIMQVSPSVWQRLTAAGGVYIDLQKCRVYDQSPLVQCTKCLGYGHTRRLCKEQGETCSHCGDKHIRKDCPTLDLSPYCTNCLAANIDNLNQMHNAFDKQCRIRQK